MHAHSRKRSVSDDTETLVHFLVEKSAAWAVGLNPFAVDNKLRDGPLASVLYDFIHRARGGLNVYLGIRDVVLGQKALGFAAIGAPLGRVNGEVHRLC